MSRFHTVIAAVDFSDAADDALDAALALTASDATARVHLLHVVPDPIPPIWAEEMPQIDLTGAERSQREAALRRLGDLAARRRLDPARVTTAVVVGPAANEIVRYAEAHAADAIAVGSHGHGLVHRFLLGSTADRVLRQAPCAVLVVPHRTLRGDRATAATASASS